MGEKGGDYFNVNLPQMRRENLKEQISKDKF